MSAKTEQRRQAQLEWFKKKGVDASGFSLKALKRVRKAYEVQRGQQNDRRLIREYFRIS